MSMHFTSLVGIDNIARERARLIDEAKSRAAAKRDRVLLELQWEMDEIERDYARAANASLDRALAA